jgi:hypothetical protein
MGPHPREKRFSQHIAGAPVGMGGGNQQRAGQVDGRGAEGGCRRVGADQVDPERAFCRSENSGDSPCRSACACAAKSHSKRFWSCPLATR